MTLRETQGLFQSTHPRGVRRGMVASSQMIADFNPRTHVGCDSPPRKCRSGTPYFNPRTHVGCDTARQGSASGLFYFNPRTHVGCDTPVYKRYIVLFKFQSTHPRGVRRTLSGSFSGSPEFQSTHPRGVRHLGKVVFLNLVDFNPRTHVGCDMDVKYLTGMIYISIHAPTWGATVKPSNGWLLGHKDNEFANENIIIINSVNIT